MNTTTPPEFDPREWEAQERGLKAARTREAGAIDPAAADYRAVARALASAPRSQPPPGFAADVALLAARREAGLDRLLSRLLPPMFVVASLGAGARYGGAWWHAVQPSLGADALGWLLVGAGCVGLSWFMRQLLAAGHADGLGPAA